MDGAPQAFRTTLFINRHFRELPACAGMTGNPWVSGARNQAQRTNYLAKKPPSTGRMAPHT